MKAEAQKTFTPTEHATWRQLFLNLEHCRAEQATPMFTAGVRALGITADAIPDISTVNARLRDLTGWCGVPVHGLEENGSFFAGLAERKFPIGNFIRDSRDINYTPAPDIFHDLYGHMPFFADKKYAEFCAEFGRRAAPYAANAKAMDLWGRLFWFGVEFPLIATPKGRRIFGGGILSSFGESNYVLSSEPEVRPFNLGEIVDRNYKIDEFQKTVFCLENEDQLYSCLPAYERLVRDRLG